MEKKGLADALKTINVKEIWRVAWNDEMRVGLQGQVRKVWAPKGVKVRQAVERAYQWRYLSLSATPSGDLFWCWLESVKKEQVAAAMTVWETAGIEALVWDNAPSHRAEMVRERSVKQVLLPSYSPELDIVERVFEEVRREIEGEVYGSIEAKVAAVEAFLQELASDKERVEQLVGWEWIKQALAVAEDQNMVLV
jgi:hypothetical protein